MKKIFNTILVVAGLAAFTACDLDLFPNNAIAYDENSPLIQKKADLDAFDNGLHASFRSYQMGEYSMTEEFMCDGFNATLDFGNNYGGIHKTDYNFTSSDYNVADFWAASYVAIKNYNIAIANGHMVPAELKAGADVMRGNAFLYRAATYLNLARHFGMDYNKTDAAGDLCVPLVLVYDQNEKPARATVEAVYKQIKADLDSAAVLLADVKGAARSEKPTIDAVKAVTARYYLDVEDYANAAATALSLVNSKTYALASTEEEMTAEYEADNGKEPIMQMFASLTEGSNSNSPYTYWTADPTYQQVFQPYYIPTKTVVDSYEKGDLRFKAWFNNTKYTKMNGQYYTGTFYVFTKYWGNPSLTSSIKNGRQMPKPFLISEMYLIAAEALLADGKTSEAKEVLNALQTARGAYNTEATVENVRTEWFKETIGEGLRMSCLKRWHQGFNGRPSQDPTGVITNQGDVFDGKVLPADSKFFCWPIPSTEIKVNKNLVQNPGYDAI